MVSEASQPRFDPKLPQSRTASIPNCLNPEHISHVDIPTTLIALYLGPSLRSFICTPSINMADSSNAMEMTPWLDSFVSFPHSCGVKLTLLGPLWMHGIWMRLQEVLSMMPCNNPQDSRTWTGIPEPRTPTACGETPAEFLTNSKGFYTMILRDWSPHMGYNPNETQGSISGKGDTIQHQ